MIPLTQDLFHSHETQPTAAVRQAARRATHAHLLLRDAVKRELEAEARGLLMAARVHGFHIAIEGGKPVVTEVPA